MKAEEAVAFAFEAAAGVRGKEAREAALVSLGLHASRTVSGRAFSDHDAKLGARALQALKEAKRSDLALRVALWEADGGREGRETAAVAAYVGARKWAATGASRTKLGWIRDVPQDAALRGVISDRLLLIAEAGGEQGPPFAAAALEAELADVPQAAAFERILNAAAAAHSGEVVARTQEGVGIGASRGAGEDALASGERLAAALEVERRRAMGATAAEIAEDAGRRLAKGSGAVEGVVALAMCGALVAEGQAGAAAPLAAAAGERIGATSAPPPAIAMALFVNHELGAGKGAAGPPVKKWREALAPATLAAGAAAASRATRSPGPALGALEIFGPDDHLALLSKDKAAPMMTALVQEGTHAAAARGDVAALSHLLDRVGQAGLRAPWEIYMRAIVADGAAEAAARHGSGPAWEVALEAAGGRRLPRFERAKMEGRAACEFVRALERVAPARPFADVYFAPPAAVAP